MNGSIDVSFRYDPNDLTAMTDPITVTGDGRSLQTIPVEMTLASLAPVFVSNSAEMVQLDSFTFHYEELGIV